MILAISGSLRRSSLNSAALRAAKRTAAARSEIAVTIDDAVRHLPPFDPDLEAAPPDIVQRFRADCEAAAGVLLAVPEYTFGIPGAFKNALDWTVRAGSLYRKPTAVLSVAPPGRGDQVREALALVLRAHNAEVTYHSVPVATADLDTGGEIGDARVAAALGKVVVELAARAERVRPWDAESDAAQPTLTRARQN